MPVDGDVSGDGQPDGSAGVSRDELSTMLEGMMGMMMTKLAASQDASLSAMRDELTARISEGAEAAASGGRNRTTTRAAAVAATADPNAAFAAQRAVEAKAAQERVARQAVAVKLRAEYEAKMVAAGLTAAATPAATAAAAEPLPLGGNDFKSTVAQVVINSDPTNDVTAAVMRRRITDNRQLPKQQQNVNLAPRRELWGANPQLTRGDVTSSREEAMRGATRPKSHVPMGSANGVFEVANLTTGGSGDGLEDGAEILGALSTAVRPTANEVARMPKADIGGPANLRGITLLNVRARELSRQTEAYRVAESVRDHNFMSDTNIGSESSLMRIVEAMLYAPADLLVREGQLGPPESETRAFVADMSLVARYDSAVDTAVAMRLGWATVRACWWRGGSCAVPECSSWAATVKTQALRSS